jgi:hypothetical protein
VSLKGNVEDLGVAELLYMVGISKRSGLLHLDGRDGEHEVLFRSGRIVAARDRKAPGSLRELFVRVNLIDDTHLSVLERQAARQGVPLAELLSEEGVVATGTLDGHLRQDVERAVDAALALTEGTFSFELIKDGDPAVVERFGGLVMSEGLDPSKLPAVAERGGSGGLGGLGSGVSLPRSEGTRRVELLVDASQISLPVLPASEHHRHGEAQRAAGEAPASRRPHVLVALAWTEFGRRLQARLEAREMTVLRPRSISEAAERVMRLSEAGVPVTLVGDATLGSLPGAELLARAKLADRAVRVVLLLDPRGTPAQRAAHRERAGRLGATHVVLLPPGEQESDAEVAARELTELLVPGPATEPGPEPVHALPMALDEAPDWPAGEGLGEEALGDVPLETQDGRLATHLREVLASHAALELSLELLEVAGEYAPRATLWVPAAKATVRGFGVTSEDGRVHARLSSTFPSLRLPARDADLPCACLRDGKSRRVPAPLAGAGLVAALGEPAAQQVAAIPLLASGRPIACLVLDDGGRPGRLPGLEALERFVAGLAPALSEALARDESHAEARRLRAGA